MFAVGLHTCTAVARSLCVSWAFLYFVDGAGRIMILCRPSVRAADWDVVSAMSSVCVDAFFFQTFVASASLYKLIRFWVQKVKGAEPFGALCRVSVI